MPGVEPAPVPAGRTGIATVCLSGTLEDKLDAAAAAGFDSVEIFENDLLTSWSSPAQVRARAAGLGLEIALYQPFRDAEGAPAGRFAAVRRRFAHVLDVMAGLGTSTVLVCSSVAPDTVDDDDLAAQQLSELADLAAARGCRIAYEALAWGRHVSTWEHSWSIVRRAAHPALGLCLDSFHVLSRGGDPAGFAAVPADRIFFSQLADAPRLSMDVLAWSRHHRVFPGQGALDVAGFTRSLLAAGYTGPLSLEVFNDVFRQADPWRTAVDARRSLLALAEEATGPAVVPPPVPVLGHAFTEIGVDDAGGEQVEATLVALGLVRTGTHRHQPVTLWESGSARVVVNRLLPDAGGAAAVRGLALESADPAAASARGRALLAPPLDPPLAPPLDPPLDPQNRPGTPDLAGVLAPDGTQVYFCRTGGPGDWRRDFRRTGERPAADPAVHATDHVALTQPFDRYDEAGLFYRSVLGLARHEEGELAAPFGLMRTHAVESADGAVRVALSVALLRRGDWSPGVTQPQHVAFATDDLFAVARRLVAAGAAPLAVPDNHYAALQARLGLAEAFVAELRAASALYDADEHGAFLHLYTPMLGGRVFFEVVQRIGGYRGYGAADAPVRMAAHRRSNALAAARRTRHAGRDVGLVAAARTPGAPQRVPASQE